MFFLHTEHNTKNDFKINAHGKKSSISILEMGYFWSVGYIDSDTSVGYVDSMECRLCEGC